MMKITGKSGTAVISKTVLEGLAGVTAGTVNGMSDVTIEAGENVNVETNTEEKKITISSTASGNVDMTEVETAIDEHNKDENAHQYIQDSIEEIKTKQVTIEGSGNIVVPATLGEGPYTIEFTEEVVEGSGGATIDLEAINEAIEAHNTSTTAHSDIRTEIANATVKVNSNTQKIATLETNDSTINSKVATMQTDITTLKSAQTVAAHNIDATSHGDIRNLIINKNLVHNPTFNLIDQRLGGEYSSVSGVTVCRDRWILYNDTQMQSQGALIFPGNTSLGTYVMGQLIEIDDIDDYKGKVMTYSLLTSRLEFGYPEPENAYMNITVQFRSDYVGNVNSQFVKDSGLLSVTFTVPNNALHILICINAPNKNYMEIIPRAFKLEEGNRQTLAYQNASNIWQLYEEPSYTEELLKCQRHQLGLRDANSLGVLTVGIGTAVNTTTAYIDVNIPVSLRANPTIVFVNSHRSSFAIRLCSAGWSTGINVDATNITFESRSMTSVTLKVIVSGGLTLGTMYRLSLNATDEYFPSNIVLDANQI